MSCVLLSAPTACVGETAAAPAAVPAPQQSSPILETLETLETPETPKDLADAWQPGVLDEVYRRGEALRDAARRVDEMAAPERERLRDAAQRVLSDCPYNRGGVEAALLIRAVVQDHASHGVGAGADDGPFAERGELWTRLRDLDFATTQHVRLLAALGADTLPGPAPDGFLASALDGRYARGLHVGPVRDAAEPGAARLRRNYAAIRDLVAGMDTDTRQRIDTATAVLDGAAPGWPLKFELLLWSGELEALATAAQRWEDQCAAGSGSGSCSCSDDTRARAAALARDARALTTAIGDYTGLFC